MNSVRRGGVAVAVGMARDGAEVALDPTDIAERGIRIHGSKMGSGRPAIDIPALVRHYEAGKLRLAEWVSGRYPLRSINEAIGSAEGGRAVRNVIIF